MTEQPASFAFSRCKDVAGEQSALQLVQEGLRVRSYCLTSFLPFADPSMLVAGLPARPLGFRTPRRGTELVKGGTRSPFYSLLYSLPLYPKYLVPTMLRFSLYRKCFHHELIVCFKALQWGSGWELCSGSGVCIFFGRK